MGDNTLVTTMRSTARGCVGIILLFIAANGQLDIEHPWAAEPWIGGSASQPWENAANDVLEESFEANTSMDSLDKKDKYGMDVKDWSKVHYTGEQIHDSKETATAAEKAYDAERGAKAISGRTHEPLKELKDSSDAAVWRMKHKIAENGGKVHAAKAAARHIKHENERDAASKKGKKLINWGHEEKADERKHDVKDGRSAMKSLKHAMQGELKDELHHSKSRARKAAKDLKKLDQNANGHAKYRSSYAPKKSHRKSFAKAHAAIKKAARSAVKAALRKTAEVGASHGEKGELARREAAEAVSKAAGGLKELFIQGGMKALFMQETHDKHEEKKKKEAKKVAKKAKKKSVKKASKALKKASKKAAKKNVKAYKAAHKAHKTLKHLATVAHKAQKANVKVKRAGLAKKLAVKREERAVAKVAAAAGK